MRPPMPGRAFPSPIFLAEKDKYRIFSSTMRTVSAISLTFTSLLFSDVVQFFDHFRYGYGFCRPSRRSSSRDVRPRLSSALLTVDTERTRVSPSNILLQRNIQVYLCSRNVLKKLLKK